MLILAVEFSKTDATSWQSVLRTQQSHWMANEFVSNIDPVSLLLALSSGCDTDLRCAALRESSRGSLLTEHLINGLPCGSETSGAVTVSPTIHAGFQRRRTWIHDLYWETARQIKAARFIMNLVWAKS